MDTEKIRYCVEYTTKDSDMYDMQAKRFFVNQKEVCKFLDGMKNGMNLRIKDPILYKCGFDEWSQAVVDNMMDAFYKDKVKIKEYDDNLKKKALNKLTSEERNILGL